MRILLIIISFLTLANFANAVMSLPFSNPSKFLPKDAFVCYTLENAKIIYAASSGGKEDLEKFAALYVSPEDFDFFD